MTYLFQTTNLWQHHIGNFSSLVSGISAMPSMHNAMCALLFLAARHVKRWKAMVAALYAVLIFAGSVHLGSTPHLTAQCSDRFRQDSVTPSLCCWRHASRPEEPRRRAPLLTRSARTRLGERDRTLSTELNPGTSSTPFSRRRKICVAFASHSRGHQPPHSPEEARPATRS